MMGCILLPLGAQTQGDVNSDMSIDIIDALLIAQYYVGLNPVQFNPEVADINCDGAIDIVDALMIAHYYVDSSWDLPDCSEGTTQTLTVEVSGREGTIPSIDFPYINPPDIMITETAQFIYDTGIIVNLYLLSSTPPPIPLEGEPPVDYQVVAFEGYESNNITIRMDSDKTVHLVYTTLMLYPPGGEPYPTGTPAPVGDGYLYYAGTGVCVIEPESGPLITKGGIQESTALQGNTGEGYIECNELPAYLTFGLQSVSPTSYYEIRFRTWDAVNQQWTFDGYTEPIRMKFAYYKAGIRLDFSRVNYIIDRIIIFPEGTPESEWQNLNLMESSNTFIGVDGMKQGVFVIR